MTAALVTASPPSPLHAPVLRWYAANARDLPWRAADASPWAVLVSEVMLQQTPVARVLPVWQEWVSRWPDATSMASSTPADAVRAWGRLGYPRRALRLHAAASAIVDRHGGEVPSDADALRVLPGIGTYTAAAVAAFAFGRRHPVVDTNVRRVHARAVSGLALPAPSLTTAEQRLAADLLPADPEDGVPVSPRWNVAVMELGALVCTARSPRCDSCPVRPLCRWHAAGQPPNAVPRPRSQAWTGTDRQVRGRLMAVLRDADGPVEQSELDDVTDDAAQRERCLESLVTDGLVQRLPGCLVGLPGEAG